MSCSSPLHATEITFSVQASWPLNSCFIEACSMAYSARGWVSADRASRRELQNLGSLLLVDVFFLSSALWLDLTNEKKGCRRQECF